MTPQRGSSPTAGQVRVGVYPDRVGWTRPFASCFGACDLSFAEASDSERIIQMFVAFHAMVVRDGIDPQVVHTALLEIDEYRAIVDGIGGAESSKISEPLAQPCGRLPRGFVLPQPFIDDVAQQPVGRPC